MGDEACNILAIMPICNRTAYPIAVPPIAVQPIGVAAVLRQQLTQPAGLLLHSIRRCIPPCQPTTLLAYQLRPAYQHCPTQPASLASGCRSGYVAVALNMPLSKKGYKSLDFLEIVLSFWQTSIPYCCDRTNI